MYPNNFKSFFPLILSNAPWDIPIDKIKNRQINKITVSINKKLDFISGGSAIHSLLNLENAKRYKIIKGFSDLNKTYDFMITDVGAGADNSSLSFMSASKKIITVLVSEPTSFADAYGLIKASFLDSKLENFGIIWNMSSSDFQARTHFEKFQKKHGLNEAKDMPTSSLEEDQIIGINDPEEDKTAVN